MEPFDIYLNVLTLNIWGIPHISKDRELRIKAIGVELAKGIYDIVALQEVWSKSDYEYLKLVTENVLPFSHYFYSGVFGSGLCIFSRYPIITTFFHSWSVNGYFHRIQHGDWFGGKGVGLCKLLINNKIVNVYNVHLHAEYDRKNDEYLAHRIIQAFDTAEFIALTKGDAILQIVAGDLNTEPDDLAAKLLISTSNCIDTWQIRFGEVCTHECKTNSYTDNDGNGKRIDYILYCSGNTYKTIVEEYLLPLSKNIPGYDISYSDHEAVYTKLWFKKKTDRRPSPIPMDSDVLRSINTNRERGTDDDDDDADDDDDDASDTDYYLSNTINHLIERTDNKKKMPKVTLEKSIEICNKSLEKLDFDKIFYIALAFTLTYGLIYLIDFIAPYGLKTIYLLVKILLSGLILYFLFMGTLWNLIEYNGILSCKLAMEYKLKSLNL